MTKITAKGEATTTMGNLPKVGEKAPVFTLTDEAMQDVSLEKFKGQRVVLNIFPSVDTPTCATSVRKFNEAAVKLPNTKVLCISMDLPFAQKRFCATEGLTNIMNLSAFRHPEFGTKQSYGVTIADTIRRGLLSRAIVVIDEQGKIIHSEQVAELGHEPNYDAVFEVLK